MEKLEIKSFHMEESKVNKGRYILVATTADGKKFVVNGANFFNSPYCIEYEKAFDVTG